MFLDAVYRLVRTQIPYLVFDKKASARLAHRLLAPSRCHEALAGDAAPQDTLWIRAVRDAQDGVSAAPGLQHDCELADPVGAGSTARYLGKRTGELAWSVPDHACSGEEDRTRRADPCDLQEPPPRQSSPHSEQAPRSYLACCATKPSIMAHAMLTFGGSGGSSPGSYQPASSISVGSISSSPPAYSVVKPIISEFGKGQD